MTKPILFFLAFVLAFSNVYGQTTAGGEKPCETLPAQPLERQMSGGEMHCYRFELAENQFLQVRGEQKSLDVVLAFYDADGKLVTEIDSPGGLERVEILTLVAAKAGVYILKITAFEKAAPKGIYVVAQDTLRAAADADRLQFEARAVFTQAKHAAAPPESLALFLKSAEMFGKIGDRRAAAEALLLAGVAAINARNGGAALQSFEKSLSLYNEIADKREPAKIIKYVGYVYHLSGNSAKALEKYEQAISLFHPKDAWDKADTLAATGEIYYKTGEFSKAVDYFKQAVALFRSIREVERELEALNNIGVIYLELGRKSEALATFQTVLDAAREIGDEKSEVIFLNNVGRAYDDLGEPRKASEHFKMAFSKTEDEKAKASILLSIGKAELDAGNAPKALESYDAALKIFQKTIGAKFEESRALNSLAEYHSRQGDKAKAAEFYLASVKIQKDGNFTRGEGATLNNLMMVHRTMNNRRLAIFYGKMAVNIFQQIRADAQGIDAQTLRAFVKQVAGVYRELAALLIDEGRIAEAQEVLILLKDEEFYQYTRRSPGALPDPTRRLELNLEETEAAEKYRTTVGDEEFVKFSESLKAKFALAAPEKRGKTSNALTANWQKRLAGLGAEIVLLTTLAAGERYYVIITMATAQTARSYAISRAELNKKIVKLRALLENPKTEPMSATQELYQILIAPVEADLAKMNAKTLLWSLDGELRYLPIAALHDGEKYLVERYANVVVTLAQTPENATAPAPAAWRALGAGVAAPPADFKPLPNVSAELKTIVRDERATASEAGIFDGKLLLNAEFSRANLTAMLAEDFQLIHFATHFVFRPGKDVDSFLLLGGGEKLSLADIRTSVAFDFTGTDLLTLSACKTALDAPDADGVEIESFGVIAQRRGARAVLASLWSIADASTRKLVTEFYRQYKNGDSLSKAEALRRAQLFVLKAGAKKPNGKHPAYWAAFTILGDWR